MPTTKVILLVAPTRAFDRGVLRGIGRYANEHGPWTFYREPPHYREVNWKKKAVSRLRSGEIDGIIMREPEYLEEIVDTGVPGICAPVTRHTIDGFVNIVTDNQEVGRMAAQHLLDRGFRHFAYCGFDNIYWSTKRAEGFHGHIEKAGFTTYIYPQSRPGKIKGLWEDEQPVLADWLASLPKPVGIMACNDDRSQLLIEACHLVGLHVPGEVAIIGVDNDEFICTLANPPLSSIRLNPEAVGYQAARLLAQIMAGRKVADTAIVGRPTYVVTRKSTDILLIDDKEMALALRYIRQNCIKPLQVNDLADILAMSRRSLQQRFRKAVGRSVHEQIRSERVKRIARLLIDSDLTISQIANQLDFSSAKQLDRVFMKDRGLTPSAYRDMYCIK